MPRLSVIVCTRDRYDELDAALASIEAQSLPPDDLELIVVDNGADPGGRADFRAGRGAGRRLRFLVEDRPGLARARNAGVAQAQGALVAFIDDDALADPDWARAIVERFARDPAICVLGGPVAPIWPGPPPAWLHPHMLGYLSCVDHGDRPRWLDEGSWLAGTNIAYRREALLAAGGFDEGLGRSGSNLLSNEEIALTRALSRAGGRAFYDPAMRVRHAVQPERLSRKWMRERAAWQIVSDSLAHADDSPPARSLDIGALRRFLERLPPHRRGPHGLFLDLPDPEGALHQLVAIEALMRLLLLNAADWRMLVDLDAGPGPPAAS